MKAVKQFRYYGDNSTQNYPSGLNKQALCTNETSVEGGGNILASATMPIIQLGIQTLPGVKFYINNGSQPVIVGATGIYELELNKIASITNLVFDYASLGNIENNDAAGLLIDAIYEVQEG